MLVGPVVNARWTELKGRPLNAIDYDESFFFKFLLSIEDIFFKSGIQNKHKAND
jgi:hypothetical protein